MSFRENLSQRFIDKCSVRPLKDSLPALESWYQTDVGRAILAREQKILDEELSYMFGYHLLQLSISCETKLYSKSRILHCFDVAPRACDEHLNVGMCADFDALPLEDESVDVTILHHVLEFSTNPHAVLKEAARVTIPKGNIIIFGFNPFSPIGLIKHFAQFSSDNPFWKRNSLRRSRVVDWLKLLDCDAKRYWSGFYHLPINHQRYLMRFQRLDQQWQKWRMPFGNFYCIVAQKDVQCITPIKPDWEKDQLIEGVRMPKRHATASSVARLSLIKSPKRKEEER